MKPWTRYYPETDSLVIQIADRPGVEVEEIAVNVLLSYDENNEVISIEIPGGATDLLKGFLEGRGRYA
ncbi:MAG: DUF2283 domain-containing protein [Dehalococcoidia bacterium]